MPTEITGDKIYELVARLYPICRSITGGGVRQTLSIIGGEIPLAVHEVPTGTKVNDWLVPREWNIKDAYVEDSHGRRVIDFNHSNLHVVGYSTPVHRKMGLAELKDHLCSLPDRPDWIPYRTSYYKENWGFCLSHRQLESLADDDYEVHIDATLQDGFLTYGECFLPGESVEEVLFFTHICHPSLCNDNLSGIALATFIAKTVQKMKTRFSYRFVFAPTTIGSNTWLSRNEDILGKIRHGLVLACIGDDGKFVYKRSRQGNADIDLAVIHVLKNSGEDFSVEDFVPFGYDERQFCSPGYDLPVGRLTRTPNDCYPEYHTSADDLSFVHPGALARSYRVCTDVVAALDADKTYRNLNPNGEPQLGSRGIWDHVGGQRISDEMLAVLWVLNLSDGFHGLLNIAERAALSIDLIASAADKLLAAGLIAKE